MNYTNEFPNHYPITGQQERRRMQLLNAKNITHYKFKSERCGKSDTLIVCFSEGVVVEPF